MTTALDTARETWGKRARRALRQIGWVRLVATLAFLVLGVHVARAGWHIPLISDAERALYDLRVLQVAKTSLEQDERIVLITYNDETLEQLRKRSPLDRGMLARALRVIDGMQPRAIGIDILFDQPQDEDAELLASLRALRTPTWLGFASSNPDYGNPDQIDYRQEQYLRSFLTQAAAGPVRPASIQVQTDLADNVVRRWPVQDRRLPLFLSGALSPVHPQFSTYVGGIDFVHPASAEVSRFTNLPIQLFADLASPDLDAETRAAMLAGFSETIRGRYVLIGGDIKDADDYETPMSRFTGRWMKGLEVHAHMLAQQLDGRMPAPLPGWGLWVAALAVVVCGALSSLLEFRGWRLALVIFGQLLFLAGLPFYLQWMNNDTVALPAFGWGVGWALAFVGVGTAARAVGSEQRRFAQSALGKYLPADVAEQIMREPELLALRGERREIYALFTDMEGFTGLSHAVSPEELSTFFNRYLDTMSDVVLAHGGTIDKFIGDAVVAFWGAPISRPDDADRAVQAAIAMFKAGETFRTAPAPGFPPVGCTRVGLHLGPAVVGNFGGEGRIQYTALGDGMNTAARLESANKSLKTTALVSDEVKAGCTLDVFRPMGRITLSGRQTPVVVWEPAPDTPAELRAKLATIWQRFDGGDRGALAELETLAAAQPEDAALAFLVYRLSQAGPGGTYVLGSK